MKCVVLYPKRSKKTQGTLDLEAALLILGMDFQFILM